MRTIVKPPSIPLDQLIQLPAIYRLTIPETYLDENRHMNIRWYLAIFDDAGYPLVARLGLTLDFHQQYGTGGFDLEHHIHYLNEVHVGDVVTIHARLIARSAKRIHYMMFMVNETRQSLAAIFECVNSFADLTVRRTAPYPSEIAAKIDELLAQHSALEWKPPTCGIMSA
jgi:acyl-CoA thioester hydrolase